MSHDRQQRTFRWHLADRFFLAILLIWPLVGCDVYPRIYKPRHDNLGTPADLALSYRDLQLEMADGVSLHAWLIPNANPNAPLVILFHGNATDLSHQLALLRFLHERGASVLAYDYRGFGLSEGKSSDAQSFHADALQVIDWLEANGFDTRRMIYDGRSLGAAIALKLAIARPPAALVLECAFTSLSAMSRRLQPFLYIHGGWAFLAGEFDNLALIEQLTVPLHLVHGRRDRIVPYRMARDLFERAPMAKSLYLITDGQHCNDVPFSDPGYRVLWENLLTEAAREKN